MKSRTACPSLLILGLLVGFTLPVYSQDPQPVMVTIETFFAPTPSAPNPIEVGWLREINAAQAGSTIRITFYSLTLPTVKSALIDAFGRGVDVRVVADKGAVCNGTSLSSLALELYLTGIPIKVYRNRQFSNDLMHNKFMVIDQQILATGSCNFTLQGTRFNHENIMIVKALDNTATFIQDYVDQFERMWTNDFPFSGHEFVDYDPTPGVLCGAGGAGE